MSLEDLEKEAKDYQRKLTTQADKTAFRFYLGSVLSGLIAKDKRGVRQEVLREATDYALDAMNKEKELFK